MKNKLKSFLDEVFNGYHDNSIYYSFGYQTEYSKMKNYDYGYFPFTTGLVFEEIEDIISLKNPNNRCGKIKESTEYIVIHDTASGAPSANALAHQNWLNSMANDINSTYCVSWHYTIDDYQIRQHLPIDEVGYHAGDGTKVALEFIDTGIKFNKNGTKITINKDGLFCINDLNTNIEVPKTDNNSFPNNDQLPVLGINYKVNEKGNYCLSNTYWNSTYKTVSNRGGNLNSIGIETCVNYGSDYTKTMRITAYLVAKLLIHYGLDICAVKQHNSFSGKNCPMTIRYNNRWNEFIELIRLNKVFMENFKDENIRFVSLTPEYLDDSGKIIKHKEGTIVSYKVICDDKEYVYTYKLGKLNYNKNED